MDEILEEDACLTVKDLAIDGKDLIALGFTPGPAIGTCLNELLFLVQDDQLPNARAALLAMANQYIQEDTL